jgi:membrane-associated phospholipid phosphatase
MNLGKRVALAAGVWALQMLYVPLNRGLLNGVQMITPLDKWIPVWPEWVVPYSLAWIIWILAALHAVWKMPARLYGAWLVSLATVIISAIAIFMVYPTFVQRPALSGEGWAEVWLRGIYARDGVFNAFPSGHVYLTTLIALYWSRWFPKTKWAWVVIVALVAFSTLFTAQHYLLDPLGGLLLAWLGYRFGLWAVQGWGEAAYAPALNPELVRTHLQTSRFDPFSR